MGGNLRPPRPRDVPAVTGEAEGGMTRGDDSDSEGICDGTISGEIELILVRMYLSNNVNGGASQGK